MELLTAIQSLRALKSFIENDLTTLLTSLELRAAAHALEGIERAKDKRSVYWSAINHLEVAEQGFISKLESSQNFDVAKQYLFLSSVKSTIYKYLEEDGLVEKCFEDSLKVVNLQHTYAKKNEIRDVFLAWNPKNWITSYRFRNSVIGKKSLAFDAGRFWKILIDKSENFGLLLIDPDPSPDGDYMYYR